MTFDNIANINLDELKAAIDSCFPVFGKTLFQKVVYKSEITKYATPVVGVKGQLIIPRVSGGSLTQRGALCDFTPYPNLSVSAEKITNDHGKIDIRVCPLEMQLEFQTWYNNSRLNKASLNTKDMTVAHLILELAYQNLPQELEQVAWFGIADPSSNELSPYNWTDGWAKQLLDCVNSGEISANNEVIDEDNICDFFEDMKDLSKPLRELARQGRVIAMVDPFLIEMYCRKLEKDHLMVSDVNSLFVKPNTSNMYIPKSNIELCPVEVLCGTGTGIVTNKSNWIVAYNDPKDITRFNTQVDKRQICIYSDFMYGANVPCKTDDFLKLYNPFNPSEWERPDGSSVPN